MILWRILLRDSRPEISEEDQRQVAASKEKADADAAVAVDMRKASMETFSPTKKRKGEQDVKKARGLQDQIQ